jgi:hypothetical protein
MYAQEITPSKNKLGAILSTNIFGLNGDLNNVDVGGGFYYSRKISNRIAIYSEIDGSRRNYGDLAISPDISGEFTTGNVAIYIGPMFDIGNRMSVSLGLSQNYLFNSELKTTSGIKEITTELNNNYSAIYFDFRHWISNKLGIGTRYERGLNSILKNTERKVTNISFNLFLPLNGKRHKEKEK